MGAKTLFIIAGILFVVGLMLALVVLLWAVGGLKNLKARIYSAVKSPVPSISNGLKGKSSSDETVYIEENGAPGYDLTPIVEMEALSPKSETSDSNFVEGSETATEPEVKAEKIGAHLMFLCVTKRTYPQENPKPPKGAFVFLEDDT